MTTIRSVPNTQSAFLRPFISDDAGPDPFAPAFEVFWQLAREEHPNWSFDERIKWARGMTDRLALGFMQLGPARA